MRLQLLLFFMAYCLMACDDSDINANVPNGRWRLIRTCGGVVGCVNSSPDRNTRLTLSDTKMVTIVSDKNGTRVYSSNYEIVSRKEENGYIEYSIKYSDGLTGTIRTNSNLLTIETSNISALYRRILF